jgi:uncharacterized protein YggL (DUF469 family)
MTEWVPSSKYEVAPGLFIGSEIGDIDREVKVLMKKWLDGDQSAYFKMQQLYDRRMELMMPKRLRKI